MLVLSDFGNLIGISGSSQVLSMPVASADNYGVIYQYVGNTNGSYVCGYFYKCVAGSTAGTYAWENIDVQHIGSSAASGTLLAASWDANKRQSVTFSSYDGTSNGVVGMPSTVTSAQKEAYSVSNIRVYSISSNVFTFECVGSIPEIDLPVALIWY